MLREARRRTGLGLRQVCERVGMSLAQLSDMERGIGTTPLSRVGALCDVLPIRREDLVAAILQDQLAHAGVRGIVVRCEPNSAAIADAVAGLKS